jgi:membrane protease YdiL (CAAX protease family)
MSDEILANREASPFEVPIKRITCAERYRWFELSLILLISFGNSIMGSLYVLKYGRTMLPYLNDSRWTAGILHELTCLLLLGYILSRRRLRLRDLGLRWSLRDLGIGIVITVAAYLAYTVGYLIVHSLHRALFSSATSGVAFRDVFSHPSIMAIPFILLNPFFEELIVRAYLMTEVRDLTGSWTTSAALSVLIQFSYHLYYGWEGAIALSFQFLVFSIYYARTRRATPIIVAHGIFDIYGLIWLS